MDNLTIQLLLWSFGGRRYALPIESVEQVVRMVEVVPVPDAPVCVAGIINVHGRVIPVFFAFHSLEPGQCRLRFQQQLIIAHAGQRVFALIADEVVGLFACKPEELVPAENVLPAGRFIQAILKLPQGLVLLPDLEAFLSGADAGRMLEDTNSEAGLRNA